jgi:hypothetical protein
MRDTLAQDFDTSQIALSGGQDALDVVADGALAVAIKNLTGNAVVLIGKQGTADNECYPLYAEDEVVLGIERISAVRVKGTATQRVAVLVLRP